MKVVSTKLTNPEWLNVVDECNQRGVSLAEYLRELIRRDSDSKKPEQNVRMGKDSSESELEQLLEELDKEIKSKKEPTPSSISQHESGTITRPKTFECPKINNKCNLIKIT